MRFLNLPGIRPWTGPPSPASAHLEPIFLDSFCLKPSAHAPPSHSRYQTVILRITLYLTCLLSCHHTPSAGHGSQVALATPFSTPGFLGPGRESLWAEAYLLPICSQPARMMIFWLTAYSLLLGMTVVAFFMTWSGWRKWFIKKISWCNKKTFYYKLILEEEKKVLEELLRKEANETLTKEIMSNIKRKDWDGCFNVAQQMINKAKHQKPEATNQQINWISEGSSNRGGQHHQAAAHQQAQNYELDAVAKENTDTMPLFNESA
ncbi:uncharacterized protein LOC116309665 isoform X2 [Oreochromis aureus]|uniref:uncharacterized protein LOC116309665 isoform X2 n=1 Tax=Oreochromis aureus TaxID=47969 RepID=UPI001953FA2E|nr:uncharacterized protein LOC116309665 isoform X2 [Oreochromis aureus]